jgi:uncharacterized membrane protein
VVLVVFAALAVSIGSLLAAFLGWREAGMYREERFSAEDEAELQRNYADKLKSEADYMHTRVALLRESLNSAEDENEKLACQLADLHAGLRTDFHKRSAEEWQAWAKSVVEAG